MTCPTSCGACEDCRVSAVVGSFGISEMEAEARDFRLTLVEAREDHKRDRRERMRKAAKERRER